MAINGQILLVDDEKIIRESLSEWLENEGFNVISAANGMDALKMFDQEHPSVAVVDIKMPGMDGVTLLKKIKEKDSTVPVIMMTAFASVENAVQSMKDGAFEYITKPFPPEKLSNLLLRIVEHQHREQETKKLKSEQRHILHIAITALVSFMIIVTLVYFLALR